MFQANFIRCVYFNDNDNCEVTVRMTTIIIFYVRLWRRNAIDYVHVTQSHGIFLSISTLSIFEYKYWEVISVQHCDHCLYRRHHVPLKNFADACTVGSPSNSVKSMPGWSYPASLVNRNVILIELSYWRPHMAHMAHMQYHPRSYHDTTILPVSWIKMISWLSHRVNKIISH